MVNSVVSAWISRTRRSAAAAVGVTLVAALLTPTAAHGAPPPPATPAATGNAHRAPVTVTLITGDRVTVTPGVNGATPSVDVTRAPGATGAVRVSTEGGDTYVYPDEAMPYLATGRLDKQLFDVTQLIAQGFDDARTSELPLIVTRSTDSATRRTGTTLPGAQTTLELPSVRGEAVRARRSQAADFWSALTGGGQSPAGLRAATSTPSFTAGVDKVWLDGKAKAALADTTSQVGAPAAWAAGGTGSGVRVAVLDSGVDTTHPDLVGQVVASRSFIPGQDVIDHNGHGTHTASTVAGTGAASDGKERGVAPDADLVVGKVLDEFGSGSISGIIAGMEWAARTEHAKVINMSLGVSAWHTQDDPLSQAVNQLTAETGALFVVSAGNGGPDPYTLGAPGTADAALTIGAVDASDHLADFSSVGPRANDEALKPDMTAPGVDVLAARSQHLPWGEGYYRVDSGTSMAAPHVAGAAALLLQKHPTWSARQIKDALMSTSVRTPDYNAYQAGSGRLNVAAAYHQDQVVATGSVDAGLVRWAPGTAPQPITRKISYTNTTANPVTLALAVEHGATSARTFTVAADSVTVPAHGTATVDVVVDPEGLPSGRYSAQVAARFPAGEVHTAVGIAVESKKHDLTIHLKDRAGRPMSGEVEIVNAETGSTFMWVNDGKLTSRLAPGSYTVVAAADVEGLNGPRSLGLAMLTAPEVDLTTDRVVELDARRARQVKVATPQPTAVVNSRIDVYRSFTSAEPTPTDWGALKETFWPGATYDSLWALPTKGKVKKGSFVLTTRIRAAQTPLAISYDGRHLGDPLVQPGSFALPDGTTRLDAVFAGVGATSDYAGLSARGKAVVVRGSDSVTPMDQATAAHTAGAAMLLVVNDRDGRKSDWYGNPDGVTTGQVPVASLTMDQGEALIQKITAGGRKPVRLTVVAHPAAKYLYDLVDYHRGGVPADPSAKTGPRDLARIDLTFSPPPGKQSSESRVDFPPYEYGAARSFPFQPVVPGPRTDWVSAGDGVTWMQYADVADWARSNTEAIAYRPGSVQKDRWFGPITRPRMLSTEIPFRGETAMSAYIQGFGDAGAAHSGGASMSQIATFYQGDKQLTRFDGWPEIGAGDLSPEKLPYRLVVETTGKPEFSPYSTATHTEWRFISGGSAEVQAIPLVQLDYGTDVDAAGRAKRGSDFSITPVVVGSTAARDAVSSLRLEVSYDDGKTWQRQDLKEKKGTWRVFLDAPHRADFVSIRVTAEQRNGGGVTQTVTRAFGLR
ncbi:S8 family serine peptidase [Micromonospora sp. WMMD961]|uniref:S8 family serine peptidase n=1 Tax=Micromonospora sp. WMMD961 TaxID=3016100 RepID=UPI00241606CA|nr:S8 family serine peptidase [Micromonospora sp. WMMD961]MDG4783651.1 S8 family serine peptidase [Micromonospora sp. WMMD961]